MVIQRRKWRNESWIQEGTRRRPFTSPIPCQTRFPQRLFVLFARVPTKDNGPRLETSQKTERSVSISTAHWRHFGNWKLELDQKSEVGSGTSRPQYPLDHPVLLIQLFISLQPANTITYVSVSFSKFFGEFGSAWNLHQREDGPLWSDFQKQALQVRLKPKKPAETPPGKS